MSLAQVQAYVGEQAVPLKCEGELIERAKVDPEAFARLYRKHRPMLLDHVYRRTGDVHVTEDLVADVFLEALRSLPGYRYRGVPLRFWLLRIATHAVNRWGRRHRRKRFALLRPSGFTNGPCLPQSARRTASTFDGLCLNSRRGIRPCWRCTTLKGCR